MADSVEDRTTTKLAIELQLADINAWLDGSDDEDHPDDDMRASWETLRADLEHELRSLEDRVLALNIVEDEHGSLYEEEGEASMEHQLATEGDSDSDDDGDANDSETHAQGQGADTVASEQNDNIDVQDPEALPECIACMEAIPSENALALDCKPNPHVYCHGCLTDLFKSAITETTLFPPRCCGVAIPPELCYGILPESLIKDFDLKAEELATPNPTHCANVDCGQFIRMKDISINIGTCPLCDEKTCVKCKSPGHDGLCPDDPDVQQLMNMAKENNWQQCSNCKNMVEHAVGCFHMTCRCQHEFCYLCGARWKQCDCPQADEDHLIREPVRAAPARARPVNPAACAHTWVRTPGLHCQACGAGYLPWVLRCTICAARRCVQCSRG